MRVIGLTLLIISLFWTPALARPGMYQFSGYMTSSADECQQIMLRACEREFGACEPKNSGRTLIVDYTRGRHNFSLQCTYFSAIELVIYSVAGSAEVGHADGLRDMIVRIKDYIDSEFE